MQNKRKVFLGINIDLLTMEETLKKIDKIIKEKVPTQHVVVNVAKIVNAQKDFELNKVINSCKLINIDGMGVVWGAKAMGFAVPERVTGIDLMVHLIEHCAKNKYKPFFFGAEEEVVSKIVAIYKEKHPTLKVAGYLNGYFPPEREGFIVEQIKKSNADVLFVAISSPQKELFLNKYLEEMQIPFVMGVGGSFDVIAGKTKRAPIWMQKCGLEWFFRVIQEPKRLWKRYFITNSEYLSLLIQEKFRQLA